MYKNSVPLPLVQNSSRANRVEMVTVEEQNGLGHGCVNSNQIPSCNKGEILANQTFLLKLNVYILLTRTWKWKISTYDSIFALPNI